MILHRKIGRPSQAHFENILKNNLIHNCPVTVDDARRAIVIYGPDMASLKGKTTAKQSSSAPSFDQVHILAPILKENTDLTLAIYYFFVQAFFPSDHLTEDQISHNCTGREKNQDNYR